MYLVMSACSLVLRLLTSTWPGCKASPSCGKQAAACNKVAKALLGDLFLLLELGIQFQGSSISYTSSTLQAITE